GPEPRGSPDRGGVLVRPAGAGADLLSGLEAGLHRSHGLAGEACHAWVDALEPRTEFTDTEWLAVPGPPVPRAPRGQPMRDVAVNGERTIVGDEELDLPWPEFAARLSECAVARVLAAIRDADDSLWKWEHPISGAKAAT